MSSSTVKRKSVSIGRHKRDCGLCAHPQTGEIEQAFVEWTSPIRIAQDYGMSDRKTVYRHAHAFGLFPKRDRNIRAALSKMIEKCGEVDVTAAAVVGAIEAYAKINAIGQWVERSEHLNLHELFDRMTRNELEKYAKDGELPGWFSKRCPSQPGTVGEMQMTSKANHSLDLASRVSGTNSTPKPGDFPVGSSKSRAAARAKLDEWSQGPRTWLHVRIVHIGHDGKTPLPDTLPIHWDGEITEISHGPSLRNLIQPNSDHLAEKMEM